jgi:hypothetical protein
VCYSHNQCFHFVFRSPCIWCTDVTVNCGSTGETSLYHTFYKTCLYKCEGFVCRGHTRKEECVCTIVHMVEVTGDSVHVKIMLEGGE